MNSFVQAVTAPVRVKTENGMAAVNTTGNACLDLFSQIGSFRDKDIIPLFARAYGQNQELALRIALWARDVRGGAGERETFRKILRYIDSVDPETAALVLAKVPEVGRWDDIFVVTNAKPVAFQMLGDALRQGNGLAAKWTPRQGKIAIELRNFFNMSPKFYRKSLVQLTNVVEQQMCAGQWKDINFSHVPSVASSRYKNAFVRHVREEYREFASKVATGEAKVNAQSIFPHEVLKQLIGWHDGSLEPEVYDVIRGQWAALPNYMTNGNILPVVDVSGSMTCKVGNNKNVSCMDVAVSLGLYCADKNTGPFKDVFVTFSSHPEFQMLSGDIVNKVAQMMRSDWGMNTNLESVFHTLLNRSVEHNVPSSEMPSTILIMSDMQFDQCIEFDDTAFEMIERNYAKHGYQVPLVVFWNLNSYKNQPATADTKRVALVSGFSPGILKAVLSADPETFTPLNIMLRTVMVPRYDI